MAAMETSEVVEVLRAIRDVIMSAAKDLLLATTTRFTALHGNFGQLFHWFGLAFLEPKAQLTLHDHE